MKTFNESDCGSYFLKDGGIYKCVAYCPYPTLGFKNLETGEVESWASCSEIIKGFKELEVKENVNGLSDTRER